ncbi:MAG: hypothetical protein ACREDT_10215 [Methylocella sp.]
MQTSALSPPIGPDLRGLSALIVFILLQPFYLWESGLPQIAHLIFAVMFIGVFISGGLVVYLDDQRQARGVLYLVLFTGWAFIVDGIYSVTERSLEPIATALDYAYGLILTLLFLTVMNRGGRTASRAIYYTFAFVAITQAMITATGLGRIYYDVRAMNFFNNPNQLAYFAVIVSVQLSYFGRKLNINFVLHNLALICMAYVCFRSLSRAGAGAIAATALLDYVLFERNKIRWYVVLLALILVGVIYHGRIEHNVFDPFNARLTVGSSAAKYSGTDELIEGRHYGYLFVEPSRLLVGWGDGQFEKHFGNSLELHATLPAVLLAFGVPGITLFILMIWNAVRADWRAAVVTLGPLFIYGFTHNGIRNPLLFAILGVVAAHPIKTQAVKLERTPDRPRPVAAE